MDMVGGISHCSTQGKRVYGKFRVWSNLEAACIHYRNMYNVVVSHERWGVCACVYVEQ